MNLPGPDFPDYQPPRWLRQGHINTIYSYLRPRRLHPPEPECCWLKVEDGVELLLEVNWAGEAKAPALLLIHGLEGDSRVGYMQSLAAKAHGRGWHAVRMNVRGCGASELRCQTLYNSGLSQDLLRALEWTAAQPRVHEVFLAGYSMGGNTVLKLLGELGAAAPPSLAAAGVVSACLDLAPSADALHQPANRLYEWRFLRRLRRKARARAARHPALYRMPRLDEIRSIRDFDDRVTAPHMGYRDAVDYYERASATRVLERIRVPTLILHAEDDPFIIVTGESRRRIAANPALRWLAPRHGGHCGFMQPANDREDAYWAENRLLDFFENQRTALPQSQSRQD